MPANLPPQYSKVEDEYRRAATAEEKLDCLQRMWALLPKHKGTDKLQADLKQKISRTKKEMDTEKKSGKKGISHKVGREGAGQVMIVGAPNSGKSQLLASLTNAQPAVAPYPFTTHAPQPGMMRWEDVAVQLIDTPPITKDYLEGYLSGMVRAADAVLLCLDLSTDDGLEQAQEVIDRLAGTKTWLVGNPSLDDQERDGAAYCKTLVLATKADSPGAEERLELARELFGDRFEIVPLNATAADQMRTLADRIYRMLNVIRVYTKEPNKKPDMQRPYTCPAGSTVLDAAQLVHKEFAENLKFARIWGSGVFEGQTVGREHVLADKDVLELHL